MALPVIRIQRLRFPGEETGRLSSSFLKELRGSQGAAMGPGLFLLSLPVVLGLPFACVGIILWLCEWSWGKSAGSMGSRSLLAGFGVLCLVNILLVCAWAWLVMRFRF